jgi:hypothetical protein
MAVVYPTLTNEVRLEDFEETLAVDPSIRSRMESGQVISRARHSSQKKRFSFAYRFLPQSDKDLLTTMQNNAKVGGDTITWTNPHDSQSYTVRLDKPIRFVLEPSNSATWRCKIVFIED